MIIANIHVKYHAVKAFLRKQLFSLKTGQYNDKKTRMDITQTTQKTYRIDRRQIHFLRFILEGYDGMAIVRTLDPKKGIVVVYMAPGCEDDVKMVLENLGNDIMIKEESL